MNLSDGSISNLQDAKRATSNSFLGTRRELLEYNVPYVLRGF